VRSGAPRCARVSDSQRLVGVVRRHETARRCCSTRLGMIAHGSVRDVCENARVQDTHHAQAASTVTAATRASSCMSTVTVKSYTELCLRGVLAASLGLFAAAALGAVFLPACDAYAATSAAAAATAPSTNTIANVFPNLSLSFTKDLLSTSSLEQLYALVSDLGVTGRVLYGLLYFALELVAVPALPLTLGSGYLFGVVQGTLVASLAATSAASASFLIARYGLRSWVQSQASKYPTFRKLDRKVGQEGFKVVFLLRLSPLLPFAISNYLYGLTSVRLVPYTAASWLGMLPGTIAYVCAGAAGRGIGDVSELGASASARMPLLALGAVATISVVALIGRLAADALREKSESDDADECAHQPQDGSSRQQPTNQAMATPVMSDGSFPVAPTASGALGGGTIGTDESSLSPPAPSSTSPASASGKVGAAAAAVVASGNGVREDRRRLN